MKPPEASPRIRAFSRFMDGLPMNPATNRSAGRWYSSCGVPTWRNSPSFSTATRSPNVMASVWSWVTKTVVTPNSACNCANSPRICTRSLASRLLSGSSSRNALGWRTMARPMATRWRWPPDSDAGRRLSCSVSSSVSATSVTRRLISAAGTLVWRRGKAMLAKTVMCGYRA